MKTALYGVQLAGLIAFVYAVHRLWSAQTILWPLVGGALAFVIAGAYRNKIEKQAISLKNLLS